MIPIFEGHPPPKKNKAELPIKTRPFWGCRYVRHDKISDSKLELFASSDFSIVMSLPDSPGSLIEQVCLVAFIDVSGLHDFQDFQGYRD